MKHDTFKLWEFFRLYFTLDSLVSSNDVTRLLIDWLFKQYFEKYKKAGR